jgi:hypothetical protein
MIRVKSSGIYRTLFKVSLATGDQLHYTAARGWFVSDNLGSLRQFVAGVNIVGGPSSAVDTDVAIFDGTTGKLIKDSGLLLSNVQRKPVLESDLSLSDVTTANVTTARHGLVLKLPNDATRYFDGTGSYSIPSGTGGGTIPPNIAYTNAANTFTLDQTLSAAGAIRLNLIDTSQGTDAKYWRIVNTATNLNVNAVNDAANTVLATALSLTRGGDATVGRNLTTNGTITVSNGAVLVSATSTEVRLTDVSQAANNQMVRLLSYQTKFQVWTAADSSGMQGSLTLDRSGNVAASGGMLSNSLVRVQGSVVVQPGGSGGGLELFNSSGTATVQSFDRTAGTYGPLSLVSTGVSINAGLVVANAVTAGGAGSIGGVPSLTSSSTTAMTILTQSTVHLDMGGLVASPYSFWMQSKVNSQGVAYPISLNPLGGNVIIGANLVLTTGNVVGNVITSGGYIYPANINNSGAAQGSFYLASHDSYGLYTNTGLYTVGNLWSAGYTQAIGGFYADGFIRERYIQLTAAANVTIDCSTAANFYCGLTTNITFSFTGIDSGRVSVITLQLRQDGTGGRTVAFAGGNVYFPPGGYVMTAGANKSDILICYYSAIFNAWNVVPMVQGLY